MKILAYAWQYDQDDL